MMNRKDLTELLESPGFLPFVITTADGAAFAIGEYERSHMLAAARKIVIMNAQGELTHIPYQAIAHIHEPK